MGGPGSQRGSEPDESGSVASGSAATGRRRHTRRHAVGLADVAERAGVSPSLVSRILSGAEKLRVREDTRQRVLAAADELRYVPHHLARNLRASRAGALGYVVHDVSNPIYAQIIRGAQKAMNAAGSVLLLVDAETVTDENALQQLAGGGRVDGLLWQMAAGTEFDSLVRVAARYVPVVLVNSRGESDISGVHLDDAAAASLAIGHLLELGHERIGFVGGLAGSDVSDRRRAAYRSTLMDAGIRPRPGWAVAGGWDPESGHQATTELLSARSAVTAVLVANAVVATGAVNAAAEAGLRVPEDLSIVAVHDLWFAERLTPPLTVVRLPLAEMGKRAVELLLSDQAGDAAVTEEIIEPAPELVVRGSTAPPGGESARTTLVSRRG